MDRFRDDFQVTLTPSVEILSISQACLNWRPLPLALVSAVLACLLQRPRDNFIVAGCGPYK